MASTARLQTVVERAALEKLLGSGLRPTRQRLKIAELLFAGQDRHVTAHELHREALASGLKASLSTIYNTLNQFTAARLLREVAIEGVSTYFDTNTADHFHFYVEREGWLIDIPEADVTIEGLPRSPLGKRISRIDVIVRLVNR
jgi:Fur family iron response transcriptional regulator